MNNSDPLVANNRVRDTTIFPPGSTASLRFDVPQGTGERADAWRISIDNYADQFGENSEFWVQWRVRMNSTYATFPFADRNGRPTGYKLLMISAGMQKPYTVENTSAPYKTYYGYSGGASQADNVMADARIDSTGEIVLRDQIATANVTHPSNFKVPYVYVSKSFDDSITYGGGNYTYQNGGSLSSPFTNANCWYWFVEGDGVGYRFLDDSSCFRFPVDQWFTLMLHVKLGTYGRAATSLNGAMRTGYTNSEFGVYAALQGSTFRLLHRRTGVVFPVDTALPQGAQGIQKYGQFGFTTFMTQKSPTQSHAVGQYWIGQIIVKSGPVAPAPPQ
jgi:hypothetical protein